MIQLLKEKGDNENMKTIGKIYKYIGQNGSFITKVLLDMPNRIEMIEVKADDGKILTNGKITGYRIITREEDLGLWKEINLV